MSVASTACAARRATSVGSGVAAPHPIRRVTPPSLRRAMKLEFEENIDDHGFSSSVTFGLSGERVVTAELPHESRAGTTKRVLRLD